MAVNPAPWARLKEEKMSSSGAKDKTAGAPDLVLNFSE